MPTVTLNTGSGTQNWTPPYDCHVIDKLELWGPGGSGGKRTSGRVTGGGAGAYNSITGPIEVAPLLSAVQGSISYLLGQGGAAVSAANTAGNNGSAKTWFSAIGTYAADFGLGGLATGTTTTAGGAGGLAANCVPTTNAVTGGNGGTCSNASGASGGGASGSASGAGVNAAAVSTAAAGAGATAPSGGGSGGAATITTSNATAGSTPGGGGGGHNNSTGNSGAGGIGQIVITYTSDPTFHVHYNLAAWTNHTFVLGERCGSFNAAYECITAGTSTTAPSGTGSNIAPGGTAHFKYLSRIDFGSLQSWADAMPATQTQNYTVYLWNNGEIVIATGANNVVDYDGKTAGSFTTLITCATGESFRDKGSLTNPFSSDFSTDFGAGNAPVYNPVNGVAVRQPSGNTGFGWYFNVANVTVDGVQCKNDNSSGTANTILNVNTGATNFTFRNFIADGYALPSDGEILYTPAVNTKLLNGFLYDRQPTSASQSEPIKFDLDPCTGVVENCWIIAVNGATPNGEGIKSLGSAHQVVVRNCAIWGYASPLYCQNAAGSIDFDHCIFDVSSAHLASGAIGTGAGFGATDAGGNLYSRVAANQVTDPINDPRPKLGTELPGGAVDATNISTSDDVFRVARGAVVWTRGPVQSFPRQGDLPTSIEWRLDRQRDQITADELLLSMAPTMSVPAEWSGIWSKDVPAPIEWSTSAIATLGEVPAGIEWRLDRQGALLGSIEWRSNPIFDNPVPAEWKLDRQASVAAPTEWRGGQLSSIAAAIEWRFGMQVDMAATAAWGVGWQGDGLFSVEWGQGRQTAVLTPLEWTGSVSVLAADASVPIYWQMARQADSVVPADWSGSVALSIAGQLEFFTTRAYDAAASTDWIAARVRDVPASVEVLSTARSDVSGQIDWMMPQQQNVTAIIEWLRDHQYAATISADWSTPREGDVTANIEWLVPLQVDIFDATIPLEWGARKPIIRRIIIAPFKGARVALIGKLTDR